jgi:hypothetical protein
VDHRRTTPGLSEVLDDLRLIKIVLERERNGQIVAAETVGVDLGTATVRNGQFVG